MKRTRPQWDRGMAAHGLRLMVAATCALLMAITLVPPASAMGAAEAACSFPAQPTCPPVGPAPGGQGTVVREIPLSAALPLTEYSAGKVRMSAIGSTFSVAGPTAYQAQEAGPEVHTVPLAGPFVCGQFGPEGGPQLYSDPRNNDFYYIGGWGATACSHTMKYIDVCVTVQRHRFGPHREDRAPKGCDHVQFSNYVESGTLTACVSGTHTYNLKIRSNAYTNTHGNSATAYTDAIRVTCP